MFTGVVEEAAYPSIDAAPAECGGDRHVKIRRRSAKGRLGSARRGSVPGLLSRWNAESGNRAISCAFC
jgi:hypothetical protein